MTDISFRKPDGYKNTHHSQTIDNIILDDSSVNSVTNKPSDPDREKESKYGLDPNNLTVDELIWLSYQE